MTRWPLIVRMHPLVLLLVVGVGLAAAWTIFLVVDIRGGLDPETARPAWTLLFNSHPVEWSQWVLLAIAVALSGYLAGRLDATAGGKAARFFLLFAIGLGLMLLEEAGDIRHRVSAEVQLQFGAEIFGLPHRVVSDVPFLAALAAIPVYAVLRYGRHVWRRGRTGIYLVFAVLCYGAIGVGNALRHLSDSYVTAGAWIDRTLFGGRFPVPPDMDQDRAHFFVMDAVVEETVELIAAALVVAMILAFARYLRREEASLGLAAAGPAAAAVVAAAAAAQPAPTESGPSPDDVSAGGG